MAPIYFDENATATPHRFAIEQACSWLMGPPVNASSVHSLGRKARGAVELSRRHIAQALSISPRHLTFTSGATESIHTIIGSTVQSGEHVLVSAVEHPAVWGALAKAEADIEIIPVDGYGRVNPQEFTDRLRPNTRLAIMMAAQNEIGTLYPVKTIAQALGHVPLLVDAVQAFGKVELNLEETGATYAVLSGHKIGAPQGVGLIWSQGGTPFQSLFKGGAQERGRRAGTENIAAIVGFGAAASRISQRLASQVKVQQLREYLRLSLQKELSTVVSVLGQFDTDQSKPQLKPTWDTHGQLPNTLSLLASEKEGDLLLQQLDLAGFCLSAGSACSSGALEPSPVLLALGLSVKEASRGLRISMGPSSTKIEVEALFQALKTILVH